MRKAHALDGEANPCTHSDGYTFSFERGEPSPRLGRRQSHAPARRWARRSLRGDGKADIVWRDVTRGDVAIWLMNGGSVRQSALFSPGVPPLLSAGVPLAWQIAGLGDVNRDGRADLVWRHVQSGDVAVWLVNVEQTLGVSASVPRDWRKIKQEWRRYF